MEYRANFINGVISNVGWGVFSIVVMMLLTSKNPRVFGWSREELLILAGCVNFFHGIFRGLFASNFDKIALLVKFGRLDNILVKPLDSQFLVSLTYIGLTSIFRVMLSIVFLIFMFHITGMSIGILQIATFLALVFLGIVLLYAIWFCVLTITIWFPDLSNVVGLMYAADDTIRYPPEMYRQLKEYIFYFLFPLTLVIVTPTKVLLGNVTFVEIIYLAIFAGIFLLFSRFFWKFALRYYTSASS